MLVMQPLSLLKDLFVDASQRIEFIDSRCLRKRLNRCDCLRCITSCPAGALSLRDHHVLFDKDSCSGCMRCLAVCPNDAFLSPENDLDGEIEFLLNRKYIVFSCLQANRIHPDDKVIPCVGLFSIELLLTFGMIGPSTIVFNVTACSDCPNKASSDALRASLNHLEEHASALLSAEFVVQTEPDHGRPDNTGNRRYFISTLASNLASVTSAQLTHKSDRASKTASTTRRIPQKTKLIKQLLERDENKDNDLLLSLCAHRLGVSSDCTLCPLCTGICPTGALKIERRQEEKQLTFNSSRCSGCGLCVSFCKHKAISLAYPLISETIHERSPFGNQRLPGFEKK